jgi:hypothetical protein
VRPLLLALTPAVALALVPAAGSTVHPGTTAPPETITVKVTITDRAIQMNPRRGQRGALARFVLTNVGKTPHAVSLGHLRHGTGTQTGFVTKALKPNEQQILILFLDFRGVVPYRGTLPADAAKPGMKGIFTIF